MTVKHLTFFFLITIFVNFFEKNVKFLAILLTVKWQFSGGSDVERSWYLVRKIQPDVRKEEVKQVVKECEKCQSIDPALVTRDRGELGVG